MPYPYDFQIGPTLAGMALLPWWNIAWPDEWPFYDWAVTELRGNGYRAGFGNPRAIWRWDNMGQAMLWTFLSWFGADTDATVPMYIRTYKRTAVRVAPATFLCLMHRPLEEQNLQQHARVRAGRMAYSASKWGLRGITKSFALEVGQYNINVNCVAPGMVDGPRFRDKVCADMAKRLGITVEEAMERHAADYALKRVTNDADVANACLFLASDVSRQITGVDLPVDGGWAML